MNMKVITESNVSEIWRKLDSPKESRKIPKSVYKGRSKKKVPVSVTGLPIIKIKCLTKFVKSGFD